MSQTVHPFRKALEAREIDAAVALLANDVVFRSPIVFTPYHGRHAVRGIMAAVFRVFDDWRCVRQIGAPDGCDHALVFQACIGDRQIEGCDFLHLNQNDSIDEFYVMVRPLSGALTLADAMEAELASPREAGERSSDTAIPARDPDRGHGRRESVTTDDGTDSLHAARHRQVAIHHHEHEELSP